MCGKDGDLVHALVAGFVELGKPVAVRVGYTAGKELGPCVGLEGRD